ncbi:nitroreductase family protein [Bradyrhizobium liaoningense]|uniref:Acg family FMN-binding oxidoreductase n=1 Tax=Bradyrhizobium liaoningense TaxID=43992 RepID=UPI001BAB1D9E|nr:nitroreductase family protein [Bradyrhizobium liaoningense]MBR0839880.1 nitroreductase family protein [Bradyrhizobium liaoningense]
MAGLACASAMWPRHSHAAAPVTYEDAVRATWAPLRPEGGLHEILRYATLAANSHNTQPWRFTLGARSILIAPDFSRRCPAVDPNDHHVFVSLGCAAENLTHAALAMGLRPTLRFEANTVVAEFESVAAERSRLLAAIPHRQSTRAAYDGKPVTNDLLRELERAGTGEGVAILLVTDRKQMAEVTDYVVEGNTSQMRDRGFMDELEAWIRFNEDEAVTTMDGLFSRASGNPALPRWLAHQLLPLLFTERRENDRYRAGIESSAGLAVFVAEHDDEAHWVEVGRACQRFALQATALGLRYAFVNQPVEVARLRRQLATYLGLGGRLPDLVVRFGAGPELPKSLRRPPAQVIA